MTVLAAVAAALAGPLGFSDPQPAGSGAPAQPAAAVTPAGAALVVARDRGSVRLLRRPLAGAPFLETLAAQGLAFVREPQAAATPGGDLLAAWAEVGRRRRADAVALLVTRAGATPVVERFRVPSGSGARPRLAVARSGTALLAFRSGTRVRVVVRRPGGALEGPRTVATGAASFALAAAGGGAWLAWSSPFRRSGRPRTLRALRLDDGARPIPAFAGHSGFPLVVSRRGGPTVRLAGAPDERVVLSWLHAGRAYTRAIGPVTRPPRRVRPAGLRPTQPASVSLREGGDALLALRGFRADRGFLPVTARSRLGGEWTGLAAPGDPAAAAGSPRPLLLPDGEGLVVWSRSRRQVGPAVFDVVVGRAGEAPAALGEAAGTSLGVAQAGDRVLLAWPARQGGLLVAERS